MGPDLYSLQRGIISGVIGAPLSSMEHRIANVPYILLQNIMPEVTTLNPHKNITVYRIVMYLESLALTPHMLKTLCI